MRDKKYLKKQRGTKIGDQEDEAEKERRDARANGGGVPGLGVSATGDECVSTAIGRSSELCRFCILADPFLSPLSGSLALTKQRLNFEGVKFRARVLY